MRVWQQTFIILAPKPKSGTLTLEQAYVGLLTKDDLIRLYYDFEVYRYVSILFGGHIIQDFVFPFSVSLSDTVRGLTVTQI